MKRRELTHMPEIEKGFPIPEKKQDKRRSPYEGYVSPWAKLLGSMEPGDSFKMPRYYLDTVKLHAKKMGIRISHASVAAVRDLSDTPDTKPYLGGCRVWCVARSDRPA